MFRYAQFELPCTLPPVVRAWRGVCGIDVIEARKGYSWTIDRDVACWFACRYASDERKPLVVMAELPKERIAFCHDEDGEHEVVLITAPKRVVIDGAIEDWRAGYERWKISIQEWNRKSAFT